MTTERRPVPVGLALLAVALVAVPARGRADGDVEVGPAPGVEEVVVTATRVAEPPFDVPYSTAVIDEQRLRLERADRTLPDALGEVPGVYVQKTAYGQGSPFIRGFTGFRTLLLVDGIRLNNAVFREGPNQYWSTVDPLSLERLEVVKGPSSALYGSDAIGGTVNAITPEPRTEGGLDPRPGAYYRYATAEQSNVVRGELRGPLGLGLGFVGGLSWKDFQDLEAGRGSGELPETGYGELDGDAKLRWSATDELDLTLAFQRVSLDAVPRTHTTVFSVPFRGTEPGSDLQRDLDQDRTLSYGKLRWRAERAWLTEAWLSLSHHLQEETEDRVRASGQREVQGFDDATYGVLAQASSPTPWIEGALTYGVEWYHDEVDSFFRGYDEQGELVEVRERGPVADDASYDLLGLYVQAELEPLERLAVILGGRWDYARARADVVDTDPELPPALGPLDEDYSAATGSLRLRYGLSDTLNLFGGVSQGFRAPNLSDLTRFEVSPSSGEFEVPAPGLDPEHFVSLEGGLKAHYPRLEAHASYHYTFIDGLIVRFPTGRLIEGGPELSKANVGDGYVQGVELGTRVTVAAGFEAFGSFAWVEGEGDTLIEGEVVREPLSRIQPIVGIVGLRWNDAEDRFWAEASATFAGDADRLSRRDRADVERIPPGGTPGYEVYAVRGGARLWEGVSVSAAVQNLTDRDHRLHGSGLNEAGTNVLLAIDARL